MFSLCQNWFLPGTPRYDRLTVFSKLPTGDKVSLCVCLFIYDTPLLNCQLVQSVHHLLPTAAGIGSSYDPAEDKYQLIMHELT